MSDVINVAPGYEGLLSPGRHVDSYPCDFRLARYPDGSVRLQRGYHWTDGWQDGIQWEDIPTVEVNADGVGVFDE